MGNTTNNNKNLKIFIETQKPYYNSGSSVEGTIFVQALTNFEFDNLVLRVQGNQWCQWFQGSSKNRRKYTGSQNFYLVEHIIHKYQGQTLEKGKYSYPFSLELSDNIPGSFQSEQHNAKIQYKIMAYFVNFKNPQNMQIYQKTIIIRQPFRQQIVKYTGQATSNPKKFGFINCGQIKLQVNFDRNVAYQGEQIQITIDINNENGKTDINRVKVQLVQYTFVSSNGNASRTYQNSIQTKYVNQYVRIRENKNINLLFKVPVVKYQTAISTLVANYYRIQVSPDLGAMASKTPCIYAPIFILHKNVDIKDQAALYKNVNNDDYQNHRPVCIRSGQYLFKKNRNLEVFNFKSQDLVTQSVYQSGGTFS